MPRSKEEAIAAGVKIRETQHSMKRRKPWHDYHRKGTYMLTLVVEGRHPVLGRLIVPAGRPCADEQGAATADKQGIVAMTTTPTESAAGSYIELTALGKAIRDEEVKKISAIYKTVEVWKLCIMPDHIHMIVRIAEDLPKGKHLGHIVAGFKGGCSRAWQRMNIPCADAQGVVTNNAQGVVANDAQGVVTNDAQGVVANDAQGVVANDAQGVVANDAQGVVANDAQGVVANDAQGVVANDAQGVVAATTSTTPTVTTTPTTPAVTVTLTAITAPAASAAGSSAAPTGSLPSLFERSYNDLILLNNDQLDNWKHYLDDNPRRLAIKRLCPKYFTTINYADIAEWHCQLVGNRFLLDIPQKVAVIVHRAYTDKDYADYRKEWLACGEAGGVLVSAAISPREKEVMREAMNRGYRLIFVRENGFPPLYKPSGESFDACSDGRLLLVSPWEYHMERRTISREQCLMLNRLVEAIVQYPMIIDYPK